MDTTAIEMIEHAGIHADIRPNHCYPIPEPMRPDVSVVIPVHNAGGYMLACVDSVLGQGLGESIEIIVVDDGSTDSAVADLSVYPDVVVLAQENRGPAAARNAGILRSRATYIAFLDSDADDLWPEGKLRHQLDLLGRYPDAALCFGDCRQFTETGPCPVTLFEEYGQGATAWGEGPNLADAYARLLTANFITTGSVVARREVLREVGASTRACDWWRIWIYGCASPGDTPSFGAHAVCLHRRRHAGNLSRDFDAMSLAYLDVLGRQRADREVAPAMGNIDFAALIAREYGQMADRALLSGRPEAAMRWAGHACATRPNIKDAWRWLQGAGRRLKLLGAQDRR